MSIILIVAKTNSNNTRSTNNPGPLSSLKMLNSQTDRRQGIQTSYDNSTTLYMYIRYIDQNNNINEDKNFFIKAV